jgi:hypothetical protein
LIQVTGLLDSIVAYWARAADFCNTFRFLSDIDAWPTDVAYLPRTDITKTTGRSPSLAHATPTMICGPLELIEYFLPLAIAVDFDERTLALVANIQRHR